MQASGRTPRASNRKQQTPLGYAILERRELLACLHVGGEISVDTVWDSPEGYCIDEKVIITNDATLIVEDTTVTRLDAIVASSADNFIDIQQGGLNASGSTFDGALPKIVVGSDGSLDATGVDFLSETRTSIDVFGHIELVGSTLSSQLPTQDVHLHADSTGVFDQNFLTGEFIVEPGSDVMFSSNRIEGRVSIPADSIIEITSNNNFANRPIVTILGDINEDLTFDNSKSIRYQIGATEIKSSATLTVEAEDALTLLGELQVAGSLNVNNASLHDPGSGRLTVLAGGEVNFSNGSTTNVGSIEVLPGGILIATDSVLSGDIVISGIAELSGNELTALGGLQLQAGGSGNIATNAISMPIEIDSNTQVTLVQNFIDSDEVRIIGDANQSVGIGNNYWNTANLEDIDARITDQSDDPFLPLAVFEPILSESPLRLDFVGTTENDVIEVRLNRNGSRYDLYINGTTFIRQNRSKLSQMNFQGGAGDNRIQIGLQQGDSHVDISPFSATILNGILPIELNEFRTINVNHFAEGNSTARFHGSPSDDFFRSSFGNQTLRGENYENQVSGFDTFQVDVNEGGFDQATVETQAVDTRFVFRDDRLAILATDHQSSLSGFDRYSLRGKLGGNINKITYWGTAGDDTFISGNGASTFETPDVFIEAELFESATARGNGGFDVARVADTPLDDNLFVRPGEVFLSNEHGTIANVFDFDSVTVISTATESGFDSATLIGSESVERFTGNSTFSELKNGDSFVRTYHFSRVTAQSGGGADEAFLYDSPGNDKFVASPNYNAMFGGAYRVGTIGFPKVTGVSNSGFDVAHFTDSVENDVFFTTPVFSRMTNTTTERLAIGFDETYANSSAGIDQAIFRDSSGDDVFVAKPNSAIISGDGFRSFAVGFAATFATATGGNDIARFVDSANNDSLFMDLNGTRLKGAGFNNFATGFQRNLVFSVGGDDFAYIVDTTENDYLGGNNDDLWMFNNDYYRFIHGFETVHAGAINGGTNRANTDVAFALNLFGDWLV